MSHRKTLSRLTIASLAAAALAAPAATAMPTDPTAGAAKDPRQQDMHASTVTKPEAPKQDLRTEAAADRSRSPVQSPRLAGPPTWPEHPQPIARVQAPLTDDGGGGDGGLDAPALALIIAGALAFGGGLAATALRLRTVQ